MGHRQFARTKKSRPHRTHQSCAWSRTRGMDVGAKYFSPGRAPSVRNRPTIKHRHAMNRGARRNLPPHHGCTGEIFFARPCPTHPQSPNHQTSPHPKSWRPPNVTTNRMCRGEIFFARSCATHPQSPNHQKWPHHKSWRIPDVTTHRMCRGEIFFARPCANDVRSPNHQTSPYHESWCASQFALIPRLYGRKIFRPYVCQ